MYQEEELCNCIFHEEVAVREVGLQLLLYSSRGAHTKTLLLEYTTMHVLQLYNNKL